MIPQGYKQTEIGVIPEDWEIKYLDEFGDVISGGTPSTSIKDYWDGDIAWCTPSDITATKGKYISKTARTITGKGLQNSAACILPPESILLCTRATIGELKLSKVPMSTNQGFKNLRSNGTANTGYLYYLLQTKKKDMLELAIGSTFLEISKKALCSIALQTPFFDEQKRIAEALSDVDSMISSLEKLIAKKKSVKQGAMQELLTGKKRLPGFDGEWKHCYLSQLGIFIKGSGISRDESNSGTLLAVRYGELYTKHNNYITKFYSHISEDVANDAKRIYYGDILFAASGETKEEIGKCAAIVSNEEVYAGGDILIFRPFNDLNPLFMGTVLNMPEAQKQRAEKGQGDAVVHIHADDLGKMSVYIPKFEEQTAIASVLSDMDNEIEALEQKLTKTRQVKQGMMQQLMTGKIRLV